MKDPLTYPNKDNVNVKRSRRSKIKFIIIVLFTLLLVQSFIPFIILFENDFNLPDQQFDNVDVLHSNATISNGSKSLKIEVKILANVRTQLNAIEIVQHPNSSAEGILNVAILNSMIQIGNNSVMFNFTSSHPDFIKGSYRFAYYWTESDGNPRRSQFTLNMINIAINP
jgi:hypothetical protein